MVGIQLISARIGAFSGHGLATNIGRHYPRWLLILIVVMLLVANTINIAADLVAMGDAVALIVGGPQHVYALLLGLISLALQIWIPYERYVAVLKWLTLSLLAYVGTAFAIHINWAEVLSRTVLPHIRLDHDYVTMIVAIFGTTISPYLFFWQASQEVEEQRRAPREEALKRRPEDVAEGVARIRFDTCLGMGVSNFVAFFIMLTAAITLGEHGVTDITSSTQAASALKPVAGSFNWSNSLDHPPARSVKFYGIIGVATLLGAALALSPVNTIEALFWSAVINGVAAVPVMVLMMLLASNREVMGKYTIGPTTKVIGWCATFAMGAAVLGLAIG